MLDILAYEGCIKKLGNWVHVTGRVSIASVAHPCFPWKQWGSCLYALFHLFWYLCAFTQESYIQKVGSSLISSCLHDLASVLVSAVNVE